MGQKITKNTIVIGFIHGLIIGVFLVNALTSEPHLSHNALLNALFPMLRPEYQHIAGLPMLLLPYFALFITCGGELRLDLARSGVYCFTRFKSRNGWYIKKTALIVISGFLYPVSYLSGLSIVCLLIQANLEWWRAVQIYAAYFVCLAPVYSMALLSCSLLSINVGVHSATVIMTSVMIVLLLMGVLLWNQTSWGAIWLFRINPICSAVAAWRDLPHLGFEQSGVSTGFGLIQGATIQAFQLLCVGLAGWTRIRRMDILAETEEG